LFTAISYHRITLGESEKNLLKNKQSTSWKKLLSFPFVSKTSEKQATETLPKEKINTKQILKLTEKNITQYKMATCCHPIPGDDVLGYIDESGELTIHKRQCPVAARLKSSYGNRIVATQWETRKEKEFLVNIYLRGIDSVGLLNEVTRVISHQMEVNIRKLSIESNDGIFEGNIQLYVHDVEDVRSLTNELKKIKNIKEVTRIEN
jgi:GTP pyrophosphokinase